MKKLIAIIVAVCAMLGASMLNTSCQPYEHGFILFHLDLGNFPDNHDVLATAIGDGLALAGMKPERAPYYWSLDGEKNAMLKKAANSLKSACEAIDKDRSKLALPLAIKGVEAKLTYTFGSVEDGTCGSYTFKEKDE